MGRGAGPGGGQGRIGNWGWGPRGNCVCPSCGATASALGQRIGVETLYTKPGSPREDGYLESFNGKLLDKLLNLEIFDTLWEMRVLVERYRIHYNTRRPHSSPG